MQLRADPLVLAVALGLLSPTVFEVDTDPMGEASPPPMLQPVTDLSQGPMDGVEDVTERAE